MTTTVLLDKKLTTWNEFQHMELDDHDTNIYELINGNIVETLRTQPTPPKSQRQLAG